MNVTERRNLMKTPWLHELNWKEVLEYLKENDTLILPVGSTETHGSHLPVGTDALVGMRLAEEAGKRTGVLVAPPLWYGHTPHHLGHAGTASLSAETYMAVVKDICCSFIYHGFTKIVVVNGHRGGNVFSIMQAMTPLVNLTGAYIALLDPFFIGVSAWRSVQTGGSEAVGHGGEMETSHMLYIFPKLVNMSGAVRNVAKKKRFRALSVFDLEDRIISVPTAAGYNAASGASGMTGDALIATKEKGEAFHKKLMDTMVEAITEIKAREVKLTGPVPLPY